MTCNNLQERLSAFSDGELSDAEAAEVLGHAGTCWVCRDFLRSLLRVRSAVSRLPLVEPESDLEARIIRLSEPGRTVPGRIPARVHRLWTRTLRVPAAALAAGLALFIMTTALTLWLWLSPLKPPAQEVVYVFGLPQVEVYGTTSAGQETKRSSHE